MVTLRAMAILAAIMVAGPLLLPHPTEGQYDPYLSNPGNVPDFRYLPPQTVNPGGTGQLLLTITNRYDMSMRNITLELAIYQWATLEESKPIEKISHPPVFTSINVRGSDVKGTTLVSPLPTLGAWENVTLSVGIRAPSDAPEGTYMVRAMLVFDLGNTTGIVMKSVGYFPRDLWDQATAVSGSLNLTLLNVTGIVPDTAFNVKDPHPFWQSFCLGLLIVAIAFFAVMAVIFYMIEEQGRSFPQLERIGNGLKNVLWPGHRKSDKKGVVSDLTLRGKTAKKGVKKRVGNTGGSALKMKENRKKG